MGLCGCMCVWVQLLYVCMFYFLGSGCEFFSFYPQLNRKLFYSSLICPTLLYSTLLYTYIHIYIQHVYLYIYIYI